MSDCDDAGWQEVIKKDVSLKHLLAKLNIFCVVPADWFTAHIFKDEWELQTHFHANLKSKWMVN